MLPAYENGSEFDKSQSVDKNNIGMNVKRSTLLYYPRIYSWNRKLLLLRFINFIYRVIFSLCMSVCLGVCVCVSVYTTIHLKLEHMEVYESSLDKINIGHGPIKV